MPSSPTEVDPGPDRPVRRLGRGVRAGLIGSAALIVLAGYVVVTSSSSEPAVPTASPTPTVQSGVGRSVVVGSAAGCVPPETIPMTELAGRLPTGITLPSDARLIEVTSTGIGTIVIADSRLGIGALHRSFRAQLVAARHEIFAEDNEGIEAELFFTTSSGSIGTIRQTRARCPVGTTRFSIELI